MNEERPVKSIEELLRAIMAASAVMLPLLWTLTQRQISPEVLTTIKYASAFFVVAILMSIVSIQFIVRHLEDDATQISKKPSVAFSFLLAWLSFFVGSILVVTAIFLFP